MDFLPDSDSLLSELEMGLRVVLAHPVAGRISPVSGQAPDDAGMTSSERREAAALMRINHVGEVCAQALYRGQALASADPGQRELFAAAAREEVDHLVWTGERIAELGGRVSYLNPLWYAGSLALGFAAGRLGEGWNLGFMAETERQVEQHLESHLGLLPAGDKRSRAIVAEMKADEARHARSASDAGGIELPGPARLLMRAASRVMTTIARRV